MTRLFWSLAGIAGIFLLVGPSLCADPPWRAPQPRQSTSHPYAVDGDTIRNGQSRIRLWGMDAPELAQSCDGQPVGLEARAALQSLLDAGPMSCRSMGTDRYSRTLGVCVAGNVELNHEMVRLGWAFAYLRYSHAYAGLPHAGPVWEYHCQSPEEYRHKGGQ